MSAKQFDWTEHLGFEVQEVDGVYVINENGAMREADLEHRVLWKEMVLLRAQRHALLAALKDTLPFMENEAVIQGYGFYRPSNPNDFHPDHESCTEQEIANHKAACEAYDAGTYKDDHGDGWVTPTMHVTKAPWGIGSYTDTIPELEQRCAAARAAIASAEKGGA